ncbi:metal ABC transporter solute-binding protein, Zn/Mn family [Desulfomonile tiedjei]|uniref:ABC-type metal ion transport system, periplasmic component/surface adhesin n=1 Tax=Desulfomonile tiedjei (strain ATCC 49306 / DSM 6799 / DCB-1) TaxID=706587 RepID=I4C9C8_DESTA|nr:zinc ABC transporter substrate-binding protein [Desulfomonile tiedjei]AFM26169.1 ABC-type metal ion transport system, periplasmic component/surface adhesin [Desulfomonile tiedjei DSM 6799]
MRTFLGTITLLLIAILTVTLPVNADQKGKVEVFVSLLPAAYFVDRIGGPHVNTNVLVGPGQDPHTFEPTPKLVAKLSGARVLFKMGFPFEESVIKKIGPMFKNLKVVDLQKGIELRTMTEEEEHDHGDSHGHAHDAGEKDPHTWLDPRLAKIQAQTIADTLISLDPANKAVYEKNLADVQKDLDAIDDQLTKALAPIKGKKFFVFHPAYGYFGDAYGLKQVAVQLGGKEPTARQLARLIELAKEDDVKVIFVQPQFSQKTAETLARSIGGAVIPLDDLAPDYLKNLQDMASKLEAALATQKK